MTVDPLVSPEESRDPLWFKRAVFYEVLVRGFADSNHDGTGDLRGLIDKLDYLQWLGVDCLWLLPIYQSPLRDNGYEGWLVVEAEQDPVVAPAYAYADKGFRTLKDLAT